MSSWADRQKKNEDRLRGQGKHEALLLQCRLREYRHPFNNSLEMKYMEREKKKIENELTKIRHTIHHERRNSRAQALSTRHLTLEAMAPRRCQSAIKRHQPTPLGVATERSPRGVAASRMSLDPLLLAAAEKSFTDEKPKIAAKEFGHQENHGLLSSIIPEIKEVNEEITEIPQITLDPPTEVAAPDIPVDQPEGIDTSTIPATDQQQQTTVVERTSGDNHSEDHPHVIGPVNRLCRRQPTFIQGRQFSFINRSNTYIKRRKEMANSSDILSIVNYNTMREGIANETLKKLGLMYKP